MTAGVPVRKVRCPACPAVLKVIATATRVRCPRCKTPIPLEGAAPPPAAPAPAPRRWVCILFGLGILLLGIANVVFGVILKVEQKRLRADFNTYRAASVPVQTTVYVCTRCQHRVEERNVQEGVPRPNCPDCAAETRLLETIVQPEDRDAADAAARGLSRVGGILSRWSFAAMLLFPCGFVAMACGTRIMTGQAWAYLVALIVAAPIFLAGLLSGFGEPGAWLFAGPICGLYVVVAVTAFVVCGRRLV